MRDAKKEKKKTNGNIIIEMFAAMGALAFLSLHGGFVRTSKNEFIDPSLNVFFWLLFAVNDI